MLTNGKKECPFTDEIVSYIYGEIDDVERGDFETHLADCTICTDDFAAISNARFSMFEWRKLEFDSLATPKIVIPELAKPVVAAHSESGWFATLVGLLSTARSPMIVAAGLLIFIGAGFVAITFLRSGEPHIAANTIDEPTLSNAEIAIERPIVDVVFPVTNDGDSSTTKPTHISTPQKFTPARKTIRAVNGGTRRNQMPLTAKKPALNDFKEEPDKSLRLTDLFDEIGG